MSKKILEVLSEAGEFELAGARKLLRGPGGGIHSLEGREDLDEAARRWDALAADILSDDSVSEETGRSSKLLSDFCAGIDAALFSPRALLAFRLAVDWALGTREHSVESNADDFGIEAPGDLLVKALLVMVNPWQFDAILSAVDSRVGESLNSYFMLRERRPGLDAMAQSILLSRDFLFRSEYLPTLEPTLRTHHATAKKDLFRPAAAQMADLILLTSCELIAFGPAVQSRLFSRDSLAMGERAGEQ
ncbi:MAG TPA: hypothetical protein VHL58_11515 [Thermoanaerobaculia bacterium]|nr:hypothetical protein [Thermoanaerobaculia bacterium]